MSYDDFPTDSPAVVTCGLPYANGDLHFGHLLGLIRADIFSRMLRQLGQQTAYVCGSDMHGTPIAFNAMKEGVSPEEFALDWHERYVETLPKFNIEFDNYGHTREETNIELTHEIVRTLEAEGYVYEKAIQVAWDPVEDEPLPDRYVVGTCPYCGAEARGDECDDGCGRHLEPGEIRDPTSARTGNPAEYRERTHKFFRVSDLQSYLQSFIDRLEGTPNAKNQPLEWIEGELQDWCITRDLDWGIDYPGENTDKLVLYVWVDAPIEYIASTKQFSERVGTDVYDWTQVWKEDGEIIHVIGPDIIQHHTIFWPAMLHVAGYNEPRAILATGFMNIDGKAFSTSRNRAIWADDYLASDLHPDLLRYFLASTGNFHQDINFAWDRFQERVNSDLSDVVGNFVYRSMLFAHRNYGGTPDTPLSADVETEITAALDAYRTAVNDYSPRHAAETAVGLARFGNRYIQRNEPWQLVETDPDRAATVIRNCIQLVKATTILIAPFVPEKAENAWSQLNETGSVHDAVFHDALSDPSSKFDAPNELFDKVDDDLVELLNEKLQSRIDSEAIKGSFEPDNGADIQRLEPLSDDRVHFDDFQRLDIRVGEIIRADSIDGADDLVRLSIDIGLDTRQVVAGIKRFYDLDSLPGTKVIVLTNLEPVTLFGVESDGMVLAAGDSADLLTTLGDATPGQRIR